MAPDETSRSKFVGALLGMGVRDALGASVEGRGEEKNRNF